MEAILKISLEDVSNQFVQNLKQKFGTTAQLEIKVRPKEAKKEWLSENDFWRIINSLDWSKETSSEVLEPAIQELIKEEIPSLFEFEDKLAEKLFQLDTKAHAAVFIENEEEIFSSDDFLYARCAVVAEGKTYFEEVLKNPSRMPTDIVFEALLSLVSKTYELKTGENFRYQPEHSVETRSNAKGWA